MRFYRPKEGIEHPAADLKDFCFFQAEYFVGEWLVSVDEAAGIDPRSFPLKQSEWKRDYLTHFPRYFLSQEEGSNIDERPDRRLVIKRLGTVPMPDFPAAVLTMFRRVIRE